MSRMTKKVEIGDRVFVVRELKVKQIINMLEQAANSAGDLKKKKGNGESESKKDSLGDINFFKEELQHLMDIALKGEHKLEDFYEMAPSEIKTLYDAFKEVNETFFSIAQEVGITNLLSDLTRSIKQDFSAYVVSSSKEAIQASLITDTPIS